MRPHTGNPPVWTNFEWAYEVDPADPPVGTFRPGFWLEEDWTVAHWLMFADPDHAGSAELELYYSTYDGYPETQILFANPKIGGGAKNRSADLGGRVNERFTPGRYIQPKLISWSGFEWVTLTLVLVRYR